MARLRNLPARRHTLLTACATLFALAVTVGTGSAWPAPPGYHQQLTTFTDDAGAGRPIDDAKTWSLRRRQIMDGMQEAMGELPPRSTWPDLVVTVHEEIRQPGHRRLRINYSTAPAGDVPAWLLLPDPPADARVPGVVALHQTVEIGKDEPAGLGQNAELRYGLELVLRGYVVLAPDYPSFGEYEHDFAAAGLPSGTLQGIINHMRGVDVLAERQEVDPNRIGAIGHSLGGHNAMFLGAFDERVRVIVSSCGWTPFGDYYGGDLKGWTSDRYMPLLDTRYHLDPDQVPFDFYEVVAGFAPRAFFSCSPQRDDNFAVAGVRKAEAKARKIFELLGAGDRLVVRYPDTGHEFPREVRREAYEFMDRMLAHDPQPIP